MTSSHLPAALVLAATLATPLHAQTSLVERAAADINRHTTFGGYVIGQAAWSGQDGAAKETDMNLRLVRAYVEGRVLQVQYKLQVQLNGVGRDTQERSPRVLDAWAEWQPGKAVRVRFGQFKRPFTFENPMHPWLTGAGSYSQLATRLAGFTDRVGEHASNGRDMGLQVQGDLLPVGGNGRRLIHYQLGAFNGQGINHADLNSRKDIIGGVYARPAEGLQVGVFGWNGCYEKDGLRADRNRLALGATYDGRVRARAEYARSHGRKLATDTGGKTVVAGTDRADAWYATIGVPVSPRLDLWAKYDAYRDTRQWSSLRTLYFLTANYRFCPNLMLQANLGYVDDRAARAARADGSYPTADLQLYVRF